MPNKPWQADEQRGGLDAELYALAKAFLAFWAALSNPPEPDQQLIFQRNEELKEKVIEIIDTYGRKSRLRDGTEQLIQLSTGNLLIKWEPPESWREHLHELCENGNDLMEQLGDISFVYEPYQGDVPMHHSEQIERRLSTNYRPAGFPKWMKPSMIERWFGPRGSAKYEVQQYRTYDNLQTEAGWVLRRASVLNEHNIEAFLMNNNKWLQCDIAPLRTRRRKTPLYLYHHHPIDEKNSFKIGVKILSEDAARRRADELNSGSIRESIRDPWKCATAVSILIGLASLAVGIAALVK